MNKLLGQVFNWLQSNPANLYANSNNFGGSGGGGGGGSGGEEEAAMFCWVGKCHLFGRHRGISSQLKRGACSSASLPECLEPVLGTMCFRWQMLTRGGRRHHHHPPPVHEGAPGVMDEYLKPLPLQIRRDLKVDRIVPRLCPDDASKAPLPHTHTHTHTPPWWWCVCVCVSPSRLLPCLESSARGGN